MDRPWSWCPPAALSVCVCVQQSQGNASAVVQSEAEPRQMRSRWAEQTQPVIICSGDASEDNEEEFLPQRLEELLGDEEGEKQAGLGGGGSSYLLYDTTVYSDR